MFTKKFWVASPLLVALAGALAPTPASACSVCRCGDPTFNALGTHVFQGGRFSLALDWDRLEKDQAISGHHHGEEDHGAEGLVAASGGLEAIGARHEGEEHATSENLVEKRFVLTAAWAINERWQLIARLPYSDRALTEGEESLSSSGMSDPEILVRTRLWASDFEPGLGRASWVSLLVGVKTDWGKDDARSDGELLDQHAQAGTGSMDWLVGLSAVRLLTEKSSVYLSLQWRFTGDNAAGYQYGDAGLLNVGYEHKLGERLDLALELNLRDSDPDVVDADGEADPNTGGAIGFVQPRFLVHLGKGLVGRVSAQVPVWDDLDGDQDEKTIWNVGLTYSF